MATAQDIPTDLALEIGADLDPTRFLAAARTFFAFVDSLAAAPTNDTRIEWRVTVRSASTILALSPAPGVLDADAGAAYARIDAATRALAAGDLAHATLSEATLDHARKLADVAVGRDGVVPIRVWVCRQPILLGPEVGDTIREETRPAYRDFGSIEGTLTAIQDGKGGLELRVRDPMWHRPVHCFLPETMLAEAMGHFRKRVELFGEIHYRKDDAPDSIRVERFAPLEPDEMLPSIDDVRGLFAAAAQ